MSNSSLDMLRNLKRSTDFINNYRSDPATVKSNKPEMVKMEPPARIPEPAPVKKEKQTKIKTEALVSPTWPVSKRMTGCQEPIRQPIRKPKAKPKKTKQEIPKEIPKIKPNLKEDYVDSTELAINAIKEDDVGAKNYTIQNKNDLDKPKETIKPKPPELIIPKHSYQCGKCGQVLHKKEFYKSKLGLKNPVCKECTKVMAEESALGIFPSIKSLLKNRSVTPPQLKIEHGVYTEAYYRNVLAVLYRKGFINREAFGKTHKYFLKENIGAFDKAIANSAEKHWETIKKAFDDGKPHKTEEILQRTQVVHSESYLRTILKELTRAEKLEYRKYDGRAWYGLMGCDFKMIEKIPTTEDTVLPMSEFLGSLLDLADFESKYGGRVIFVYCNTEDSFFEVYQKAKKTSYDVTIDAQSKAGTYHLKLAQPGTETEQAQEEKAVT